MEKLSKLLPILSISQILFIWSIPRNLWFETKILLGLTSNIPTEDQRVWNLLFLLPVLKFHFHWWYLEISSLFSKNLNTMLKIFWDLNKKIILKFHFGKVNMTSFISKPLVKTFWSPSKNFFFSFYFIVELFTEFFCILFVRKQIFFIKFRNFKIFRNFIRLYE